MIQALKEVGTYVVKFLLILCVMTGCSHSDNESKIIKGNTFITSKGIYYFNGLTLKISEIDKGCLVFSLKETKKDNVLIYGDIFKCFSKNQKWCLYLDEDDNIWFYNSDYQESYVWIAHENYKKYDYVLEKIRLPKEFEQNL